MAINPLAYTEKILRSFLRYQLTANPLEDESLNGQLRELLSLEASRRTPLFRGPYVSLSRSFAAGCPVRQLVAEGIFHPHMKNLIPYPRVYGHQEEAIRNVHAGRTTLVSTGTGSGKSECFLYPIISHCLRLREAGAPPGIAAVLVYPMNALAEDQLGRLRGLLTGSGISFGMYVGKTPETEADVAGRRLPANASRQDYEQTLRRVREQGSADSVLPPEEVCSRQGMRTAGQQPRILLTNVKQLELILTRQRDTELFEDATLDYLVFDEAHTFSGAAGAETACLVRRLRNFCGKSPEETVCVATSATIVDERNPDAARDFASRFFGSPREDIATVQEVYEAEDWAEERQRPPALANPAEALEAVRAVVDAEEPATALPAFWQDYFGEELEADSWEEELGDRLVANEFLYQIAQHLQQAASLERLVEQLEETMGRAVTEEEVLFWLTLGAVVRRQGRPLLRPVVHGFVRGIPGGVVVFDEGTEAPRLLLSADDDPEEDRKLRLPLYCCTTCGQHYFEHYLADFEFCGTKPGGGQAGEAGRWWETLDKTQGGRRVFLTHRLISTPEEEDDAGGPLPRLYLCRHCGAMHEAEEGRCHQCGHTGQMIPLLVIPQKKDRPGYLARCACCGTHGRRMPGGRIGEPAKPLRATNVADIHVLTQDMVHHAERKRLIVFADNRQEAAFQAGWMKDHARRFRFRRLLVDGMAAGMRSLNDLVYHLEGVFDADNSLSNALLPEVWAQVSKDSGQKHRELRRYSIQILLLMELTHGAKQQVGLEPWGRIHIRYTTLDELHGFVQKWAKELGLPADEFLGGVSAVLDHLRRKKILYFEDSPVFSRAWQEGDREIQSGLMPFVRSIPKGVKLRREGSDDNRWVDCFHSPGHQTLLSSMALKWGVEKDRVGEFLKELWDYLTHPDVAVLRPVSLKGSRGKTLPNCSGVYQVDAAKLILSNTSAGAYRCRTCRRKTARRTPHNRCLAWQCNGELEHVPEDPDNYDLQLLDQGYNMLRPEEHTAMVPVDQRIRIENLFKGKGDSINALVCTQTLELGVDIGSLDAVLMRNMPPLPANYWQRAGRAGRRHRMAVNFAYCRPVNHDRAYFAEPLKMLKGQVDPPSFNLANGYMVEKHVHATVISRLHQLAGERSALAAPQKEAIRQTLAEVFPPFIRSYLFDAEGQVMERPLDVSALTRICEQHRVDLFHTVKGAFQQGWPEADHRVVDDAVLQAQVRQMGERLQAILQRLFRRLRWALQQLDKLENKRRKIGTLDEYDDALYRRCDRFVKKMKGTARRRRSQQEGVDDTLTWSVLSIEGFLPGYGMDTGSVVASAAVPPGIRHLRDFDLPRPTSVALREFVPGNLIYANGQKFIPRFFHREFEGGHEDILAFDVDFESESIVEVTTGGQPANHPVNSVSVCDVTLLHQSRISDEEVTRFQMAVRILGRELGRHNGGRAYAWAGQDLQLLKGNHLQLVNVGASSVIQNQGTLGYPVCTVCGQSVSPMASARQLDDFREQHKERCGKDPVAIAFHAVLTVDCLKFCGCESKEAAYTVTEGIRFAAAEILEMELEDLQILVLGNPAMASFDALLYDPMPGGSGLLERIVEHFGEIVCMARAIAEGCPSRCERSCIDCFQTYRNSFYHEHLNRNLWLDELAGMGERLADRHAIPAKQQEPLQSATSGQQPANVAEAKLKFLLEQAGLPGGDWNRQISLPPPLSTTTPDVAYDDPDDDEGKIYLYLDGLSAAIHGNPETRQKDLAIRNQLRSEGHQVIELSAHDLDDPAKMEKVLKKLARLLIGREALPRIKENAARWVAAAREEAAAECEAAPTEAEGGGGEALVLPFILHERPGEGRISVYSLEAAAGAFGAAQEPEPCGFAEVDLPRPPRAGEFIARVVGHSMEPTIPNGSWCLFHRHVAGSRYNRILIVQHHAMEDPETGGRYTIKRYARPPQVADGQRGLQGRVVLKPDNPDFAELAFDADEAEHLLVIAELVQVLGG